MPHIALAEVREILNYDPVTGVFTWRHRAGHVAAGAVAGSVKNGNRYIRIGEADFLARRLAWLFVHGEWPAHSVKMANGEKDDCRASNLLAPLAQRERQILSADRLREVMNYDPKTGVFTWKHGGPRHAAGAVAGAVEPSGYRSLSIDGAAYLAQRCAWLYVHGVWPSRVLRFKNNNRDDASIDNLDYGKFRHNVPEERSAYERLQRRLNPDVYRAQDLKKGFGITLEEYQRLFVAQNGLCAICGQPERDTRNGKVKWLAVDHDHADDHIRGLLCSSCNTGLGKFGDSIECLEAALAYLRRDAEKRANVVPIRSA